MATTTTTTITQMLQQQIVKLQEVLAAQPLLQLEQRVQMQRQVLSSSFDEFCLLMCC
jgi:hypothetical protein